MKECNKCLVTKPYTDYYSEKRVADGHQAQCKDCMNVRRRQYRATHQESERAYYQQNRERILQQHKDNYQNDELYRKQLSEKRKEYYVKNAARIKAHVKAYANTHKDMVSAYNQKRRLAPDFQAKAIERSRKYRAQPANKRVLAHRQMKQYSKKYGAKGFSTKAQLDGRWEYYGGRCYLCNKVATEMDHVKPISKGGSNWPANLKPICRLCNVRKGNKWPYKPLTT